jgi:PrtD family type I secretion system ABC transporter
MNGGETELKSALRQCRPNIGITIFFSFFINLLMFVAPIHMLQIYDRVLVSRSTVTLLVLTGLAVGLLVIYGLLEAVRSRILVRTGIKFDEIISNTVFKAVFSTAVSGQAGGSITPLRDVETVRSFISGGPIIAFCDAPWVPIFITVIFLMHPVLGLVALIGAILIFSLAVLNEWFTRRLLDEGTDNNLKALSSAGQSLRNAQVVHALGMISALRDVWAKNHSKALSSQAEASDRGGSLIASSKFVRMALQVSILAVGAYLVVLNEITAGTMIAASIIMGRALAPVELAVGQWRVVSSARQSYQRLNTLFAGLPEQKEPMQLPEPTGSIELDKIIVTAPADNTVILRGISLKIQPGSALGIIGPSGSGKSSLARALVGVWPVRSGTVRYDKADLAQWDPEYLGRFIGYMPQDVELFSGSVAENIARFQALESERVVAAARSAGVHNMILELRNGYETNIGVGGQSLSGGQRQRIALARALYGKPRVLVLDEPNANLDSEGEHALSEAIQNAKNEGCSVVVISHRPSLLANVDGIAVLKEGVVVKYGERDSVLAELSQPHSNKDAASPANQ